MNRVFKYKRKKGPVASKKITYDGVDFASGLEKYMYIALKKAKIKSNFLYQLGQLYFLIIIFGFMEESHLKKTPI